MVTGDRPRPEPASGVGWRSNRRVGLILLALLGVLLLRTLLADWVDRRMSDGFLLGFFPVAAIVVMMLCALALIFDGRRHEEVSSLRGITWRSWGYCVLLAAGSVAYMWLWEPLGFLLTTPVVLFVLIYGLGARPWYSAALSAVLVDIGIYGIFRALDVQLPAGPLPL